MIIILISVVGRAEAESIDFGAVGEIAGTLESDWLEFVLDRLGTDLDEDETEQLIEHLLFRFESPVCLSGLRETDLSELGFLDTFEIDAVTIILPNLIQYRDNLSPDDLNRSTFASLYSSVIEQSNPRLQLDTEILGIISNFIDVQTSCGYTKERYRVRESILRNAGRMAVTTENRIQLTGPTAMGIRNGNYVGSPLRYRDRYIAEGPGLSLHLARSKAAGEDFQAPYRTGFQSFHVGIQAGERWQFILGDYTIQSGTGLMNNRSAMSRGTRNLQRFPSMVPTLRPYRSGSHGRFHRGGAVSWFRDDTRAVIYASSRALSATEVWDNDELAGYRFPGWSSLRRTSGELDRYQNLSLKSVGGHVYHVHRRRGIMVEHRADLAGYWFSDRILARDGLANEHQFDGRELMLWSAATQVRYADVQGFVEWSGSLQGGHARVYGLRSRLGIMDGGIWHRSYDQNHYTVYGSGMGVFSGASNELGTGVWVVIRPRTGVRLRVYVDRYRSVGVRADADAGVWGWERGAAAEVRVSRGVLVRAESMFRGVLSGVRTEDVFGRESRIRVMRERVTVRASVRVEPGSGWMWQGRGEVQGLSGVRPYADVGRLGGVGLTQVVRYRSNAWELVFQHTLFNTDAHDTRIFAYEYDLHNVVRIPSFSGSGQRVSLVAQYRPTSWLLIRTKAGRTSYNDRFSVGSGNDMTEGPFRSDVGIQIITRFR
ncbi:MAG: hypothetical protein JJU41_08655 [Bacteroidetes bacterium]|nr:hypothetical protein [Bacteroidota bacterium]